MGRVHFAADSKRNSALWRYYVQEGLHAGLDLW